MTDNPMGSTSRGSVSGDDVASMLMRQGSLYCGTCRRALNVEVSPVGSVTLRHSEELRGETVDHPADPVPLTELDNPVMVCDFCSRPDPAWCYVTGDQTTESRVVTSRTVGAGDYRRRHQAARTRTVTTAPGRTQQWGQRWSACESCAELVEARDVYGLVGRVADAMPAKYTRGNRLARVRGELHGTFSNVIAGLHPGRGRITPEHPLGVWEPAQLPAATDGGPDASSRHGAARW
jgi:hypothetical protein